MPLSLPLPLRPEHRLTQLITTVQQVPLPSHHVLLQELQFCVKAKASWLLSSAPATTGISSLPPAVRRQLQTLDEEAQRLHWLHSFCTNSTLLSQCTQIPKTVMSPAARSPLPQQRVASQQVQARQLRSQSSSCPLLLMRLLLISRLPDHLLRLLKWLVHSQAELKEQRMEKEAEGEANNKQCIAQINRIQAHCAAMEEMTWKILYKIEQLIKSGVLSCCSCKLPESMENLFSPWWNHDCMIKTLRIISASERLEDVAIHSFTELLIGDMSLFGIQLNEANRVYRTPKSNVITEIDMLPNYLFALAHTTPELTHQGLEFLSMMLIRLPENGEKILRHGGWQSHLVPLMMTGGAVMDSLDHRSRSIVTKTLTDILSMERRSSVSGSPTQPFTHESLLATNVRLSLNIWVLLMFTHFTISSEGDETLGQIMHDSIDAIEDQTGWLPQTILVVRVLLVSLIKKINSSPHKRIFRNDLHHSSWSCLFDVLTVCENFIFYSPLAPTRDVDVPHPHTKLAPRGMRGAGASRRSCSGMQDPRTMSSEGTHLARPKDTRRFKVVGLHVSSLGVCEDAVLVDAIAELLDSLKLNELELNLDSNAELVDRERMKKLKKRGLCDIEFFGATAAYFQQCAKKRGCESTELPSMSPASSSVSSSSVIRSVPELLEKRRHQRSMSGGRLSGMFLNLTRSRRLRSMEMKLNGFVQDPEIDRPRPSFTVGMDDTSTGRHFNMLTRRKHARPAFHDQVHAKLNLELVKLKIESHYLPHKRILSHPNVPPPPIPSTRPQLSVFQQHSRSSSKLEVDVEEDDVEPPLPPYSPTMAACFQPQQQRGPNHPRQLSQGVPITSLLHLMNRPLPILPDRQVPGTIVLSPTRGDRERCFEPKEREDSRGGFIKEERQEELEAEEADEAFHACCQCNNSVADQSTFWHYGQSYCHCCFKLCFCCCASCGQLIQTGSRYARINGLEESPVIKISIATDEDVELPNRNACEQDPETIMYHADCLECHHCVDTAESQGVNALEELLSHQKDRFFQRQGRVYCEEEFARLYGDRCAQCSQIITGSSVNALNKHWHADCFLCAGDNCGRPLTVGQFYLAPPELISPPMSPTRVSGGHHVIRANRVAYCQGCFAKLFQSCHFCQDPIDPNERGISVKHAQGKRPYHTRCFQCVVCLKVNSPDEKLFAGEDDDCLYCYQHWIWKFLTKCSGCSEPIVSEERGGSVTVNEVEYHRDCVQCFVCKEPLYEPGQEVYTKMIEATESKQESQMLLCKSHQFYEPEVIPKCAGCSRVIASASVKVGDSHFHSTCVTCSVCRAMVTPDAHGQLPALPHDPTKFFCRSHFPSPPRNEKIKKTTGAMTQAPISKLRTAPPVTDGKKKQPPPPPPPPFMPKIAPPPAPPSDRESNTDCPQCRNGLGHGSCVQLSNAVSYHTRCLYCSVCRCPFSAKNLQAFEVLPTTNRIYCLKHVPQ